MSFAPRWRHLLLPSAVVLVAACGGDGTTEPSGPVTISISPTSATLNGGETQTFTVTVSRGSVTWSASCGNLSGEGNSRTYTAPTSGGPCTVTATSVDDPTKSASATVTVIAASVAVSPATSTIDAGATQQFTATVSNSSNTAVTWSTSAGSIVASGNNATLTAPATGGNVTVTATSVADPTRTGTATVTVNSASVSVSPAAQLVFREEPISLTAEVTGAADASVTWTSTCGTITGIGATVTWTAPNVPGPCTITAASALDPSQSDATIMTVRPDWRVAATDDNDDGTCNYAHCSLREAFNVSNANADVDTIRIVAAAAGARRGGLAGQAMLNGVTITLESVLPNITTPIHILGPGKDQLTIDANAEPDEPRRIFTIVGDIEASVRGMTLTRGVVGGSGGALHIINGPKVELSDLAVTNNRSHNSEGGGIFVANNSMVNLTDVDIVGNQVVNGINVPGGGLSVVNGAEVTMTGGRVSDNTVEDGWGGGVRTLDAKLTMIDVQVTGNKTLANAGGGGGILAQGELATLTLNNVTISNNESATSGGGLRLLGVQQATISNSTISNNLAVEAAGVDAGNSPITMSGTTISGNTTTANRAGGMLLWGTTVLTGTDVTVTGNTAKSGTGGGLHLLNDAAATLTNSGINGNVTEAGGGAGMVLWNSSSVTLTNSTVNENQAKGANSHGGGVQANSGTSFTMNGGEIAENTTEDGSGGAINANTATTTLTDVTVRNNVSHDANLNDGNAPWAGGGLSIVGGELNTTNGSVTNNSSDGSGGGVFLIDAKGGINGTQISQNTVGSAAIHAQGGGIGAFEGSSLTLENTTVTGNTSTTGGGGIQIAGSTTFAMTGGEVSNNRTEGGPAGDNDFGGGIRRTSTGVFTMEGTRVADNVSAGQGGGLWLTGTGGMTLSRITVTGNTSANGGGGAVLGQHTAVIENSTFSGNTTTGTGGGIFSSSTATSTFRNTTFSGNTAGIGGGLGVTGTSTVNNSTFVGNTATTIGGGISVNNGPANLAIMNSLLANNTGPGGNCGVGVNGGTITSGGNNLSSDNCAQFVGQNDKNNTAPGVNTTLADNGGPTFTHALLEGSAAINAGNAGTCVATDQRGAARVGTCDIGAFEFGGTAAAGMRANTRSVPRTSPVRRKPPTNTSRKRLVDVNSSEIMR